MMREVKGLLTDASMDWMCVLGHHHRRQRPKSVQGFHPELTTKLKVVAVCPPNSLKPCHPCKSLPLTTTTFVGDRTEAPHSAVLPTKRAALATAEGANLQRHTQSGCTGILFSSETLSREMQTGHHLPAAHVRDTSPTTSKPPRYSRAATLAS
jgi:hypothetical protein